MNYMLMPLRRYADFQGRSRRKEYWMWVLFNFLVSLVLGGILLALFLSALGRVDERGGLIVDRSSSSYQEAGDGVGSGGTEVERRLSTRPSRDSARSAAAAFGVQVDERMLLQELGMSAWLLIALASLWSLIIFIPNLAVIIRRLHDLDKSGWMILIGLIPLIGVIVLLVFFLMDGTRGPNRFGADPKGQDVDRTFA